MSLLNVPETDQTNASKDVSGFRRLLSFVGGFVIEFLGASECDEWLLKMAHLKCA